MIVTDATRCRSLTSTGHLMMRGDATMRRQQAQCAALLPGRRSGIVAHVLCMLMEWV